METRASSRSLPTCSRRPRDRADRAVRRAGRRRAGSSLRGSSRAADASQPWRRASAHEPATPVTIVVPTLDEAQRIAPLIDGVLAQGTPVAEIVVRRLGLARRHARPAAGRRGRDARVARRARPSPSRRLDRQGVGAAARARPSHAVRGSSGSTPTRRRARASPPRCRGGASGTATTRELCAALRRAAPARALAAAGDARDARLPPWPGRRRIAARAPARERPVLPRAAARCCSRMAAMRRCARRSPRT